MANDYTPQQIEEILQMFFDVAGTRQYIGARYVPIFGRGRGTSVDWDNSDAYEPLSIVYYQGDTYTSRRYVPAGIPIDNQDYWVITGRYNAQVEQYRQEVLSFQGQIDGLRTDMETDYVPFPDALVLPKYGSLGQVLTTLANGETKWEDPVVPSDEQATEIIGAWLDDHPEATTTVEDDSLTNAKFKDGCVTERVLAPYLTSRNNLNRVNKEVFRCLDLSFESGLYNNNGFQESSTYIRAAFTLSDSDTYYIDPISTNLLFNVYTYVSPAEGTAKINERSGRVNISGAATYYINVRKQNTTDGIFINAADGNRGVVIYKKTANEIVNDIATNVSSLNTLTAMLNKTPTSVAALNNVIKELLILNPQGTSYGVARLIMDNSGVGNIAIRDSSDWVCYRAFNAQNPAQANTVYEIPEYNNSGTYCYVVFKTIATTAYSAATLTINANCLTLTPWTQIGAYLENLLLQTVSDVEALEHAQYPLYGKSMLVLGDSIFGQNRSDTSIPSLIAEKTGMTVYNCALGGTRGITRDSDGRWEYYDFGSIATAISTNTWTNQVAHVSDTGVPSYFADVITQLQQLDWTSIEYVLVNYGGNDYTSAAETIAQFTAGMVSNVETILTAHPNVRIILVTPPYKFFMNESNEWVADGSTREYNGLYLNDFVEAFYEIGESLFSPVCNIYTGLGINKYNTALWFETNDGSHPSADGRRMTADYVSEFMRGM